MKKDEVFVTNNAFETQKIAKNLVEKLRNVNILALYGDLGSGKTTFTQGLAKAIGIEKRIISPTFNIIRTHKVKIQNSKFKSSSKKLKFLYHIDLYRIDNLKDIKNLGLNEILNNKENLVVIEWAEKMKSLVSRNRIDINFEYLGEDKRKITIKFKSQRAKIKT